MIKVSTLHSAKKRGPFRAEAVFYDRRLRLTCTAVLKVSKSTNVRTQVESSHKYPAAFLIVKVATTATAALSWTNRTPVVK